MLTWPLRTACVSVPCSGSYAHREKRKRRYRHKRAPEASRKVRFLTYLRISAAPTSARTHWSIRRLDEEQSAAVVNLRPRQHERLHAFVAFWFRRRIDFVEAPVATGGTERVTDAGHTNAIRTTVAKLVSYCLPVVPQRRGDDLGRRSGAERNVDVEELDVLR